MEAIPAIGEDGRTTAILESLDVAAFLLDINQTITHVNEPATLILDVSRHELIGQQFFALQVSNPHYLQVRASLERAMTYPPGEQQSEVNLHVRGRDHIYLLKPAPLRLEDNSYFGTLVTLHDVSYLRDKERARSNLIATLSDELKTPLTSLSLGIELLQRKTTDPEQHEIIGTVIEDLERIRDLSDGLLNITREETPSIVVKNVSFDFGKLVSAAAKRFAIAARQKEIALHIHIGTGIESYGDPLKLAWVISSLVGNALRATPEGGSVEVSADRIGKNIRLTVTDSGSGVSREILDAVFEQAGEQLNADGFESGSTGLDLTIAKEIVEAHGGRIFLDTRTGGSTFVVDLPHFRCI